jgi:hypothetical protein
LIIMILMKEVEDPEKNYLDLHIEHVPTAEED